MVQAIIDINERTNRILNILKAKYGLKDKSQGTRVKTNVCRKDTKHRIQREIHEICHVETVER